MFEIKGFKKLWVLLGDDIRIYCDSYEEAQRILEHSTDDSGLICWEE